MRRIPAAEKLLRKAERNEEGCLIWTGCLHSKGYGRISWGTPRKTWYAHRASYETFVGPIPEGLTIDHMCGVHACIEPTHLQAVTVGENNRLGGRNGTAWCVEFGHNPKYCSERCKEAAEC